jgi:glycosyltransferase involved in cell wall biosynthesis
MASVARARRPRHNARSLGVRVLITSPVFPPDLGGPAVYVPSIARFLMERGHEVRVVAFCAEERPVGHPFPVRAIPRGPLPVRYLKAFFAVLSEAGKVDVVYVQEHLALLHVLAARLRGRPVVIRIMVDGAWEISHRLGWIDGDSIDQFEGKRYGFKVGLVRFLQRRWWGMCTRIIACSDYLRRIPIERYGVNAEKMKLVYNAYHGPRAQDVPHTRASARAQLGLPQDRRYLLTICRLMVWKGVDGILRALKQLPEDVHLLIAGDGDMEQPWRALAAELGLAERAHFLGNVPHRDVLTYIRAADVFVLNSEYEGLSHTLLEVSTLGTPIVCTGVCGNPEVVEHDRNGFLVRPKDDAQLVQFIHKLITDQELSARFSAEGMRRAERFTREATFPEVERVLREAQH